MNKLNKYSYVLIVFIMANFILIDHSLADPVPINVGEKVVFTNFNFNEAFYSDDPVNTSSTYADPTRTTSAADCIAYTTVSASAGQAGMAEAHVGVEFSLNYGVLDWKDVKDVPVLVTLEFDYDLSAQFSVGTGSSNAFATYNLYNTLGWPAYKNIGGYENDQQSGSLSGAASVDFNTTYGELQEEFSNRIFVNSLSQAHVTFSATSSNNTSSSKIKLKSITLSPSYVPTKIDIRPFSQLNIISLWPKVGIIPIAILSTQDVFMPDMIDKESLTFGYTGNEDSAAFCSNKPVDVNNDGYPDLLCFFYKQYTGFECGDTEGTLMGTTTDGSQIVGRDSVRIVPCGN